VIARGDVAPVIRVRWVFAFHGGVEGFGFAGLLTSEGLVERFDRR
jgi:hypothetical protein